MQRCLSDDWEAAYGNPLRVAESLVSPTKFRGTMYKAANGKCVGRSKGEARAHGRDPDPHGEAKDRYGVPLRRDAGRRLRDRAPRPAAWAWRATRSGRSARALRSRYPQVAALSDVRRAPGRTHGIASVRGVRVRARPAHRPGAGAAARCAKARTQKDPAPIGAGKDPDTGRQEPVSRSTVHRVLQNPDPAWIEEALRHWAQPRLRVGHAIAVDGKRMRGANRTGEDHYETVSLIEHGTGMPVSILNYHDEGGEIAAVHAALETAPVAGRLLTLDALHTTRETARRIVETHGADGRMTVKGNAPKTFETFESIHWETTSTGRYSEKPTLEHGRIEQRSIEVFTPPAKMIHDPHVKPIFRVTRRVEFKKSGKRTMEHAYLRSRPTAPRRNSYSHGTAVLGWSKAITPSAIPPSAKTTPCSGPATHPQTTRSSTPLPLPSSSTTRGSCPSPSTASPTPVTPMPTSASRSCTPSQDPTDCAHTPTETARIQAGPPNPAGLSLAPDPPKRTPRA